MEHKVSCLAMAVERQLLFFTAPRNTEMPEKRWLPFPMLQSLQPPMQQSQPCRSTGTTLPPCLHKGEHNLHHPTWQQVIQALSNGALALLGTGWQRQKIWESRGQQDLTVPLETSACRSSCRLHVTFNAHSCAQRAGNIPDAWARMPGGMKDGVE